MANPSTFIKIDRNILRWRWYGEKKTLVLFLHFLLKANFGDGTLSNGRKVKRGQYVFTSRKLADELQMTQAELRTALGHLEETGEIKMQGFPRFTLVTITNYDKYQNKPPEKPKQKPKKQKKAENQEEEKREVPKEYREYFGDDYESYERWANQ